MALRRPLHVLLPNVVLLSLIAVTSVEPHHRRGRPVASRALAPERGEKRSGPNDWYCSILGPLNAANSSRSGREWVRHLIAPGFSGAKERYVPSSFQSRAGPSGLATWSVWRRILAIMGGSA